MGCQNPSVGRLTGHVTITLATVLVATPTHTTGPFQTSTVKTVFFESGNGNKDYCNWSVTLLGGTFTFIECTVCVSTVQLYVLKVCFNLEVRKTNSIVVAESRRTCLPGDIPCLSSKAVTSTFNIARKEPLEAVVTNIICMLTLRA